MARVLFLKFSESLGLHSAEWLRAFFLSAWVVFGATYAGAREAFPPFSWDHVPVYGHLGKTEGDFTPQELDFLAQHFPLITIEKGQALDKYQQTEAGIFAAARELKQRNPRCRVLFYWNAFIDNPLYEASHSVKAEWHLKTAKGTPLLVRKRLAVYDLSLADVRQWWASVAANAMDKAPLDGIFADAFPQVLTSAKSSALGEAKHREIVNGLRQMMDSTHKKLGPDKIILANGTRANEFRELLDWDSLSGVMIEHFAHFNSDSKEDIAADMQTVELAGQKGKLVVLKAWPGFSWQDADKMHRPHAELVKLARERLQFPLACFLVVAQPGSYFCYSWGYRHEMGMLDWYPEFDRPLGPPQGVAQHRGWTYTRTFAHAQVFVDLEKRTAHIEWKD